MPSRTRRIALSDERCLKLPLVRGRRPVIYWDAGPKRIQGFCCAVTSSTKAWRLSWDLPAKKALRRRRRRPRGETICMTIGRVGQRGITDRAFPG